MLVSLGRAVIYFLLLPLILFSYLTGFVRPLPALRRCSVLSNSLEATTLYFFIFLLPISQTFLTFFFLSKLPRAIVLQAFEGLPKIFLAAFYSFTTVQDHFGKLRESFGSSEDKESRGEA